MSPNRYLADVSIEGLDQLRTVNLEEIPLLQCDCSYVKEMQKVKINLNGVCFSRELNKSVELPNTSTLNLTHD